MRFKSRRRYAPETLRCHALPRIPQSFAMQLPQGTRVKTARASCFFVALDRNGDLGARLFKIPYSAGFPDGNV
jgi:hypothetical protein